MRHVSGVLGHWEPGWHDNCTSYIRKRMTASHTEAHEAVTPGDLKALAAAHGPCLTAVVPLPDPAHIEIRVKNAIHGLETNVEEQMTDPKSLGCRASLRAGPEGREGGDLGAHPADPVPLAGYVWYFHLLHGNSRKRKPWTTGFREAASTGPWRMRRGSPVGTEPRNVRLLHCTHRAEPVSGGFPTNLRLG
jgi:hypothetical protein